MSTSEESTKAGSWPTPNANLMSVKRIPDAAGDTLTLLDVDGVLYPKDSTPEVIRALPKFTFRDDDVMVCSYPKSGCHWVWEITRMLQEGTTDVKLQEKEGMMMEWMTPEFMDKFPSPRVLNSHVLLRYQNPELFEKKIKIIFVYRNPKDVAVSFYNHHKKLPEYEYKGKFVNYLSNYLEGKVDYGSVFDYTRDWEAEMATHSDHPIIVLRYEDMKENLPRAVKKLGHFLGKSYDDSFYEKVAENCCFKSMHARNEKLYESLLWTGGQNVFYRKGEVGDWKNWFTVAQSEMLDLVCKEKMAGSKFRFRYTLNPDTAETNNNDGGSVAEK